MLFAVNILEKIVAEKRVWLERKKTAFPLENFREKIVPVPEEKNFYAALAGTRPAFILECKKASPSRGLIRPNFDPAAIARVYKNYATAVSVLCDEPFFQGKYENIPLVAAELDQPILAKDFIVDEYQIFLARYMGASAILLMLSVLSEAEYLRLANVAHSLKMGILTEVDTLADAEIAKRVGARVIGINNRNLRNLQTDISRTAELANFVRGNGAIIVAESGILTHSDIVETLPFCDAFLIGSSLMAQENLDAACRNLLGGNDKICGLTRIADAQAAADFGATFGGLIFAEKSPRKIVPETALAIKKAVPALKFVALFQNQSIDEIAKIAAELQPFAIQLHGNESPEFARNLRERVPAGTQIWKALSSAGTDFANAENWLDCCEMLVLDSGSGGTGTTFDWTKIPRKIMRRSLLAGGINCGNVRAARAVGCAGLDINSGAEDAPGLKNPAKLRELLAI